MADRLLDPYVDALGEFPLGGGCADKLRAAVSFAVQAPSSHNSQPWRFHLRGDALTLRADRDRALSVTDPANRELIISCGAALYLLRVTLRRFGCLDRVDLLPEPSDPDRLAVVTIEGQHEPSDEEHALFHAIEHRATNRFEFAERALSETTLRMLERAAAEEGAWLEVVQGTRARTTVADLVAEADRLHMADRAWRWELASWLRPNRSRRRDGMPGYVLGMGGVQAALSPLVVRTMDLGEQAATRDRELAVAAPVLAVVGTVGDTRRSWLLAGQGLARMLLRAQVEGIQGSFLNGPIEVPELRQRLSRLLDPRFAPQLLLRLGYPTSQLPRPSRRTVDEVLTEE